jgi:hypothetical protein
MKYIYIFLLTCFVSFHGLSQQKVYEDYSGFTIGKGNIQSELTYNTYSFIASEGDLTSLVARYGLSNTVELNMRCSHWSNTVLENEITGFLPMSFGSKFFVFDSPKARMVSHVGFLLPWTSGDINSDRLGFHFDFILNRKFNDIFSLESTIGILHQLEINTPYINMQGMVAVTESIDVFNQLDLNFREDSHNYWYRIGTKIWVSEDIKLNFDYGIALESGYDNRFSIGILTRWLN